MNRADKWLTVLDEERFGFSAKAIKQLLTQDEQVRCFENVAAHLTQAGLFVIEGGVPEGWISDQSESVPSENDQTSFHNRLALPPS